LFQDYILDLDKTELKKWNEEIKLSSLEFNLLKYFAQNPGKTLSRQEIYEKVWGEFDGDIMFSKTIEVYIWYVRKKLSPNVIITVKWMWYKFGY
jgi:DNA-binding response OmpR family regulator